MLNIEDLLTQLVNLQWTRDLDVTEAMDVNRWGASFLQLLETKLTPPNRSPLLELVAAEVPLIPRQLHKVFLDYHFDLVLEEADCRERISVETRRLIGCVVDQAL